MSPITAIQLENAACVKLYLILKSVVLATSYLIFMRHVSTFILLQRNSSKIILPLNYRNPALKLHQSYASLVVKSENPQNADFPRYYSRKEKKPFPIPIVELRRAARERFKNSKGRPKKPVPPPKNGLLVKSLVPLAYDVFNARITLINNLKKLLKVVRVHACR